MLLLRNTDMHPSYMQVLVVIVLWVCTCMYCMYVGCVQSVPVMYQVCTEYCMYYSRLAAWNAWEELGYCYALYFVLFYVHTSLWESMRIDGSTYSTYTGCGLEMKSRRVSFRRLGM